MDKKIKKIIKFNIILGVLEFIVLTFTILYGLEFGFKKWNWITIISCVSVYIIVIIAAIIYDNIGKTKVSKEELIVSDYYKEQAQLILNVLDKYLVENSKIANDLKLYWPFYKGILKRVANGKKLNGKDYGVVEKLKLWQEQNYEDPFLINIYDVLKNIIV